MSDEDGESDGEYQRGMYSLLGCKDDVQRNIRLGNFSFAQQNGDDDSSGDEDENDANSHAVSRANTRKLNAAVQATRGKDEAKYRDLKKKSEARIGQQVICLTANRTCDEDMGLREKIFSATGVEIEWLEGKIVEVLHLAYRDTPAVVHFRVQLETRQFDISRLENVLLSKNDINVVVKNSDLFLKSEFYGIPASDTDSDPGEDDEEFTLSHEEDMQEAAEKFGLNRKALRKKRWQIRAADDRAFKHFGDWRRKAYYAAQAKSPPPPPNRSAAAVDEAEAATTLGAAAVAGAPTMSAAANTEMGEDERPWKQLLEVPPLDDPPRPSTAAKEARVRLQLDEEFLGRVTTRDATVSEAVAAVTHG